MPGRPRRKANNTSQGFSCGDRSSTSRQEECRKVTKIFDLTKRKMRDGLQLRLALNKQNKLTKSPMGRLMKNILSHVLVGAASLVIGAAGWQVMHNGSQGSAPSASKDAEKPTINTSPATPPGGSKLYTRASGPRLAMSDPSAWTDIEIKALGYGDPDGKINDNEYITTFWRGCVINPGVCGAYWPALDAIAYGERGTGMRRSGVPSRDAELLILRNAYLAGDGYMWTSHSRGFLRAGGTEEELMRIKAGPDAPGWGPFDATLLRAAEELHRDTFISDETFKQLQSKYTPAQIVGAIFTVGHYNTAAMLINSIAIPFDRGNPGDFSAPRLKRE